MFKGENPIERGVLVKFLNASMLPSEEAKEAVPGTSMRTEQANKYYVLRADIF